MELKLDAKALIALFPEGSEARLKLQQCVIEEFAKRQLTTLRSSLSQVLANAVQDMLAEATEKAAAKMEAPLLAAMERRLAYKIDAQIDKALDATLRKQVASRLALLIGEDSA